MPIKNKNCTDTFSENELFSVCLQSEEKQPNVLLLGDSHSHMYYTAFEAALDQEVMINIANWGCLPFVNMRDLEVGGCVDKQKAAYEFAVSSKTIETVILAGSWGSLSAGGYSFKQDNYRFPYELTKADHDFYFQLGTNLIEKLQEAGKKVVIFKDIPNLDFNINSCFNFGLFRANYRKDCTHSASAAAARNAAYESVMDEIISASVNLYVYDPKKVLCNDMSCYAKNPDGMPLYRDGDHLTRFGSNLVVKDFLASYPLN
jgi:hypothetical protein